MERELAVERKRAEAEEERARQAILAQQAELQALERARQEEVRGAGGVCRRGSWSLRGSRRMG